PLADRYREHFLVLNKARSRLFPMVREVLEQLGSDYLLAVATGKSRRGLEKELDETGLRPLFHASRCADETYSKPHPLMLQEIIDELAISAVDALVIGDTEFDMQMAANAGASALGVSYGVHDRERLLRHGALHCLDAIHELPQWVKQHG
ncbi:MAG: HAD-IA family hydrolase, partial [Pseudomonadota bacterium]